jgi:hypothetical protein
MPKKEKTAENISRAKAYILKQPALKLKGLTKPEQKTPQSFLREFFSNYNRKLETVYCSNGQTQTMPGKRRSITDIYLITVHYYPKASLTKLYIELLKLITKNVVVSGLCKVIHKRVYRGTNSGEQGYLNGTLIDEFGVDLKTFKVDDIGLTTQCQKNTVWGNYTKDAIEFIQT